MIKHFWEDYDPIALIKGLWDCSVYNLETKIGRLQCMSDRTIVLPIAIGANLILFICAIILFLGVIGLLLGLIFGRGVK